MSPVSASTDHDHGMVYGRRSWPEPTLLTASLDDDRGPDRPPPLPLPFVAVALPVPRRRWVRIQQGPPAGTPIEVLDERKGIKACQKKDAACSFPFSSVQRLMRNVPVIFCGTLPSAAASSPALAQPLGAPGAASGRTGRMRSRGWLGGRLRKEAFGALSPSWLGAFAAL